MQLDICKPGDAEQY